MCTHLYKNVNNERSAYKQACIVCCHQQKKLCSALSKESGVVKKWYSYLVRKECKRHTLRVLDSIHCWCCCCCIHCDHLDARLKFILHSIFVHAFARIDRIIALNMHAMVSEIFNKSMTIFPRLHAEERKKLTTTTTTTNITTTMTTTTTMTATMPKSALVQYTLFLIHKTMQLVV